LENKIRKIQKYEWEKINIKTTVYFEKYIPKKYKFWKTFSENNEGKIGISRVM
jgi:hypothetical protein